MMDLRIYARIQSLISQREGMIALNTYRSNRQETIAYTEEEFFLIAKELDDIYESLTPRGK